MAALTASVARHLEAATLAALPGVGDRGFRLLVDGLGSAEAVLANPKQARLIWPRARVSRSDLTRARAAAAVLLERSVAQGLFLSTYGTVEYPSRLTALHDPPALLWGLGDPLCLQGTAPCAVVGSRRATPYGLRTARSLGHALASAGIGVSSGMALGVDSAAHDGAMEAGGTTIAVLGSGVDVPTPKSQRALYSKIVRDGLVVSEFPPGAPAAPHNFPRRNRIIAALSRAVVVVEATGRSGALITVDHALDLGVAVYAVPGAIDTARSRGTNALLADGAGVVVSPEALIEELGGSVESGTGRLPSNPSLGPEAVEVWKLLDEGPSDVDTLALRLQKSPPTVLAALGTLEVAGWIRVEPGARYAKAPGSRP